MDKLFLIDGHALVFKMYYAFLHRPMINSKGADMSILYGFTKYLLELVGREHPTHLAVAFDPPGGTFRNQMYPQYKGTRPPTPQLVIDALEPLTELLENMNIPVLMVPGFEADDVIGSAASQFASESMDVYMVTPDKDYGQLIGPHVFQYKPGKAGADAEIWGTAQLCEKWGIKEPSQVIDMLAICGDTADNVPGVKGVGEVGAAKLIGKYGSLENIYANLGELSAKQQALFADARPHMALSKALVTIKTDMELPVSVKDTAYSGMFRSNLARLFDFYEFGSLKKYLTGHLLEGSAVTPASAEVTPQNEVNIKGVSLEELIGLHPAKLGLVISGDRITLSDGKVAAVEDIGPGVKGILEDASVEKFGEDLKKASRILDGRGILLAGKWNDVRLMHYVLDPERSHDPSQLAKSLLGIDLEQAPEKASTGSLFDDIPLEEESSHSLEAAVMVLLGEKLRESLPAFYDNMEEPLSKVLAGMEKDGVKVDIGQLRSFADKLRTELTQREQLIREMAGEPSLNISSPKQIGELLFDKMQLDPKAKKSGSKGTYSTDEATLQALAHRHPIINEILEYRGVKKLLSTYIEPFPSYVSELDGRVHTTFNQALTATGRLSSSNPNLQNIPIRTERGKEIRKAFVADGGVVVSADYSQIELRIMAHLSGDSHLIEAFKAGEDVHAATAAKIFGIPVADVTREQRSMAKTANFGIMYGISSFGLAQRLGLPRGAAKQLIEDYFTSFPAIRGFIDSSVEFARTHGYVETLFGRRRYLPDILQRNANVRSLAERNAVNAPIQGTSADIIKLAMIGVADRLKSQGFRSRMVLQIHDELLFDAFPEEVPALQAMVKEVMENIVTLSVPLTVECSSGQNWLEAH
ncbi:MAG: DNA polymerase I [Bacteroidales bacterium]|nr:DNA polymerase I [Bacteroidales bacterium]